MRLFIILFLLHVFQQKKSKKSKQFEIHTSRVRNFYDHNTNSLKQEFDYQYQVEGIQRRTKTITATNLLTGAQRTMKAGSIDNGWKFGDEFSS